MDITRFDRAVRFEGPGQDSSTLSYGPAIAWSDLLRADLPVLRYREDLDGLGDASLSVGVATEFMEYLVSAHMVQAIPPSQETLAMCLEKGQALIREAKEGLYKAAGHSRSVYGPIIDSEDGPSTSLIRAALSLARLRGNAEAGPKEFDRAAEFTSQSFRVIAEGGPKDVRRAMRETGGAVSLLDERRRTVIRSVLVDPHRPEEVWDRIRICELFRTESDCIKYLNGLLERSVVIQLSDGRLKYIE